MFRQQLDRIERTAAQLGPDDIRRLAAAYRQWRDVLTGALDSVDPRSTRALSPINERLRGHIVRAARGEVGPIDIEDAIMGAWLALLAATDREERPVVALLAGPWRQAIRSFEETAPRTQADRVTFNQVAG